ncbi:MAG: hypothetical protein ACTHOH_00360 [Lysobacteraceae bacterium]
MLRWLLFLSMLVLTACASGPPKDAEAEALVPVDPVAYTGQWTPDPVANRKLARALQKQLRQRMAKLHPSGPPGGMGGGPGGGGPMGGGPGGMGGPPGGMGGGPPGGMPPGGPPGGMPDIDPLAMMSMVGMMRPEMDFALPLQADLRITLDPGGGVELGAANAKPVTLMFRGGARELGGGNGPGDGTRGFATLEDGRLVIELDTGDGTRVTHTYLLEAQGKRLRVRTLVASSRLPMPGGLPLERVYDRVEAPAAVTP